MLHYKTDPKQKPYLTQQARACTHTPHPIVFFCFPALLFFFILTTIWCTTCGLFITCSLHSDISNPPPPDTGAVSDAQYTLANICWMTILTDMSLRIVQWPYKWFTDYKAPSSKRWSSKCNWKIITALVIMKWLSLLVFLGVFLQGCGHAYLRDDNRCQQDCTPN